MSARQEPSDPETDDLRRVVEGVPGVGSAEVVREEGGRPTVKIQLDGTRNDDDVLGEVREAIASWRRPPAEGQAVGRRRTGLGRGLDVLLAESHANAAPPAPAVVPLAPRLVRVAVVEADQGVSVQATDSAGTLAVVFVGAGGIEHAVVAAIATLLDVPVPEVLDLGVRAIAGHDVATAVIRDEAGSVLAGSAPAGFDRLHAMATAVWRALED